jgi:predicted Zn-dependent protease
MFTLVVGCAALLNWSVSHWPEMAGRAERAAKNGDFEISYRLWSEYNAGPRASPESWFAQAKAALAMGHAADGVRALEKAAELNPSNPEPWQLQLEILRVEDRPVDALGVGWKAYDAVPRPARRGILRALTLALLTETPEDLARTTLQRWVAEDSTDLEARVALLRRMAANPRDGDLPRSSRIETLEELLRRRPESISTRQALIEELADAGDGERAKQVLENWPERARDARFDQVSGRLALDLDRNPKVAAEALKRALAALPHDWKIHYRYARALAAIGAKAEAKHEADRVGVLREILEPGRLAKRLDADLRDLEQPRARADLAALCRSVGFDRLGAAWEEDADRASDAIFGVQSP